MFKIPDIWSIFEAVEASFEAANALGDLVDAVRTVGGRLGDLRVSRRPPRRSSRTPPHPSSPTVQERSRCKHFFSISLCGNEF